MAGFYPNDPLEPYLGLYGNRRLVGRGRGSPAGGLPVQAREADPFNLTRERIGDELANDPALRRDFDANTTAEVGVDPIKRRMYQATTIDRAVQTGKPLADVVNAPDYYPPETRNKTATSGQQPDPSIWEGANPANYATGNASFDPKTGRWAGFAGGPQTATSGTGRGMELYGIEGQAGLPYARAMGYRGPERTAIGPSGPSGDQDQAVAGLYEQANAPADYPKREEGRKMPAASLMDMLSGKAPLEFTPQDATGQPTDFGGALRANSNSLVGLGMGLLQPTRPGESPYANALQGYQAGSVADSNRGYRQAQLQHQKTQDARQAAQDRQAQQNWERQFSRGGETDFQKIQADIAKYGPAAEKFYATKTEGEWDLKDIVDPRDPEQKITVQQHKRTGEIRMPRMPGGDQATAPAPGGTPEQRHAITLPSGEVVTPPPGLNKEARKMWAGDVAKTVADMQTGKMTEGQAKYSIYATGMEIAHQELKNSSELGTSAEGKGLGGLPWGVGAYFQSNKYQNYRNSKDAWLNAKLRAESGATINPDEFARDDRIYFPQPGEGPEQVAAKAKLRDNITQKMTKAAGPGYVPAPTGAPASSGPPAAPAATSTPVTGNPLDEARHAIRMGAPRAKVIERLAKQGIRFNPKDLD